MRRPTEILKNKKEEDEEEEEKVKRQRQKPFEENVRHKVKTRILSSLFLVSTSLSLSLLPPSSPPYLP
jgi:hypothetical protein